MAGKGAPVGNDHAKKAKVFFDAVRKACVQEDWKRLHDGVDQLLNKAAEGERWALEMLRDTTDGKPKQQIVGGDEGDAPLELKATVEFVNARTDSAGS